MTEGAIELSVYFLFISFVRLLGVGDRGGHS
jgi:hypothetical protein